MTRQKYREIVQNSSEIDKKGLIKKSYQKVKHSSAKSTRKMTLFCLKQRCKYAQKLNFLGGRKRKFALSSSAKRIFFFSRRLLGEIFLCSANLGEAKLGEFFAEFRLDSPSFFRRDSPRFAEFRLVFSPRFA